MTLNQLKMHNLAPRGIRGTCVPTSICFVTGACYQDVEAVLVREQPKTYRPDIQGNGGVDTVKLFGQMRRLFDHVFTRVIEPEVLPIQTYSFRRQTISVRDFARTYSVGTYVVRVPKHMFVIKGGEYFDLCDTKPFVHITDAWKVEKA